MVYDVVVVGAGPAGSMAAYSCAKAGLTTLLIDKDKFPRDKPCGGALSQRSIHTLHQAGIEVPDEIIERTISSAQLMGPDKIPFHIHAPEPFAFVTRRNRFDAHLAKEAVQAGAEFIDECELTNLSFRIIALLISNL